MSSRNANIIRTVAIIVGLSVAFWGLYVIFTGKYKHTDPEQTVAAERISVQLKGFAIMLLGMLIIPAVGFLEQFLPTGGSPVRAVQA
jgi:hypothetical protein